MVQRVRELPTAGLTLVVIGAVPDIRVVWPPSNSSKCSFRF